MSDLQFAAIMTGLLAVWLAVVATEPAETQPSFSGYLSMLAAIAAFLLAIVRQG